MGLKVLAEGGKDSGELNKVRTGGPLTLRESPNKNQHVIQQPKKQIKGKENGKRKKPRASVVTMKKWHQNNYLGSLPHS